MIFYIFFELLQIETVIGLEIPSFVIGAVESIGDVSGRNK